MGHKHKKIYEERKEGEQSVKDLYDEYGK